MKPNERPDDDDLEAAEPYSTVRPKRHRVDPRLETIANAARSGELSAEQALEQISQVLDETLGAAMPDAERFGTQAAMRMLARDPRVLALFASRTKQER